MAARKKNWDLKFWKQFGPNFKLWVNNPEMGTGGEDVFRFFGKTNQDKKMSLGMDQSGRVEVNADVSIDIIAGEHNTDKGTDILVHSRRGNVTLHADRNGSIVIKGQNVRIKAGYDMELGAGHDIKMTATNEISMNAKCIKSKGKCGNSLPMAEQWISKVTAGSFIGADKLGGFLDGGVADIAASVATGGLSDVVSGGLPGGLSDLASGALPGGLSDLASGALPGGLGDIAGNLQGLASGGVAGQLKDLASGGNPLSPSSLEGLANQFKQ